MADNEDENTKDEQMAEKQNSDENDEDDNTMYIGVDPEHLHLFKNLDIDNYFGFGSYLNSIPKIKLDDDCLTAGDVSVNLQQTGHELTVPECKLCAYKSTNKIHLKRHMARVHEKSIQCDRCSFTCGSVDYLKEHKKAVHEGEKLKCMQCPAEYTWRSDLSRHVKRVHSGIVYSCFICNIQLNSDKNLKRHISKSKCRLLLPPNYSVADLQFYIKSGEIKAIGEEGEPEDKDKKEIPNVAASNIVIGQNKCSYESIDHQCEHCNQCFTQRSSLKTHQQMKHQHLVEQENSLGNKGIKLHDCPTCAKKFNKLSNLKVHINSIHEMTNLLSCEKCIYTCTVRDAMKQHTMSVHYGEKYPCTTCEKVFTWKSDMKRHIRNFHMDTDETHSCKECSKTFSQKRNLSEHLRNRSCRKTKDLKNKKLLGEDLVCSYCGYTTADKRTLERHINRVHLKEGVTKCELCEYRSVGPADLKYHFEHKHIGKEYICEICSKICKWKSDLDQHLRMHQGVEYGCDVCDFRTVYISGLSRHKKSAHEGIKYQCDQCTQCYTQKSRLKTHQKLKHPHLIGNKENL